MLSWCVAGGLPTEYFVIIYKSGFEMSAASISTMRYSCFSQIRAGPESVESLLQFCYTWMSGLRNF